MALFGRTPAPASAAPQQAYQQPRRGLMGRGGPNVDWGAIGSFLLQGPGGLKDHNEEKRLADLTRQQRFAEDRLRAQLSPADGPNGSGTGAAPSIDAQMAALDEASLLNPAAAQTFAPIVQGRQMRQQAGSLFADDPRAAALWASGNDEFRKSVAAQYAPQVVAAGATQVVNGRRTVEQPTYSETGDTTVERSSQGVNPVYTRMSPSITERTAQQNADTARANSGFTLGPAQTRFTPDGSTLAATAPAPNPADNEDRAAIAGFSSNNERFRNLIGMVSGTPGNGQQPAAPPAFDLSPLNAAGYKAALATGIGMSPAAAAYGNYVSEIRSAVSDALRLNTGPQTDQDAIREAQALLSNVDNKDYVLARLPTVIANNERLAAGRQSLIQQRAPQGQQAQGGQPDRAALMAEARRRGLVR